VTLTKNEKSGLEVVYATDSVVFLIHVADTNQILMVEQSREPMKNKTNQHGLITELPAGRFDIRLGVKGLAQKEALEEVGARVSKSDIGILNKGIPVALSPGILTEKMYLVYIKINSNQIEKGQRVFGNKSEGEKIRRRFVTVEELKKMTFQDMKTFALAQWFLRQIGK
jgi:8-oxo-dGTP pyrophosphatase MutT (NUDIX family)